MTLGSSDLMEVLRVFREEVREISERMSADFLALEVSPKEELGSLFGRLARDVHTIKGAAGSLQLHDLATLTHDTETLLKQYELAEQPIEAEVTDVLLAVLDEINAYLDAVLAEDAEPGSRMQGVRQRMVALIEGTAKKPTGKADAKIRKRRAAKASEAEAPGVGEDKSTQQKAFLRVSPKRLENLSQIADDLLLTRLQITQRGVDSRRIGEEMETLVTKGRRRWGPEQASQLRKVAEDVRAVARDLRLDAQRLAGVSEDFSDALRALQVLPASTMLEPFRRAVRDHARKVGIDVVLDIFGADVSADRRILEAVHGPVMHLLRNCIDHGIEPPAERATRKKPKRSRLRLEVEVVASRLHLSVIDDGRGIDPELLRRIAIQRGVVSPDEAESMSDAETLDLIWRAGFSTAASVTMTSGRGVGLDAVRDSILQLHGHVDVSTEQGKGTTFRIEVPVVMAATLGLLIESAGEPYLLPLSVVEVIGLIDPATLRSGQGGQLLEREQGAVPVVPIAAALSGVPAPFPAAQKRPPYCIVSDAQRSVALVVDAIRGESEMAIRPLGSELHRFKHLAGASFIGDGRLVPVLNVRGLIPRALDIGRVAAHDAGAKTVLVVEDSVSSRLLYRSFLEAAGYRVLLADNGQEGLDLLLEHAVDAVIADVRMPRIDGLEMTRRLRMLPDFAQLPIILVTSLGSDDDRREGLQAGANTYLIKAETTPDELVEVIGGFLQ